MREERSQSTPEKKTVIREYYERLYANKLGDLEEMDKSLEGNTGKATPFFFPRNVQTSRTEKGRNRNVNRPITSKGI